MDVSMIAQLFGGQGGGGGNSGILGSMGNMGLGGANGDGAAASDNAFGIGNKGEGVNFGAMATDAVSTFATAAPMIKDIGLSTSERMDEKGAITHKANVGGKALSMAATGAEIAGPWGALGGAVVGGVLGLIDKNQQPTLNDQIRTNDKFNMGLHTKTIRSNDTFAQQAQSAEYGMKYAKGTKLVEVEKDEIVLRKTGSAFKKVADFKGGKSHDQGGEPYVAQEGDVIIPGKKRLAVDQALRTRDWSRIESIRQTLPADKAPAENYPNGTAGIKPAPSKYNTIHLPTHEDKNRQTELQLAYAEAHKLSGAQVDGFRAQRKADRQYAADKQAYIEKFTKDWRSQKTGNSPNAKFSQTSPEYRAMAKNREKSWYDSNPRQINETVAGYYKEGPQGFNKNEWITKDTLLQGASGLLASDYEEGTSGIKTGGKKADPNPNTGWTAEMVQDYINAHTVKGKTAPISGQELLSLANKHDFPIELALVQGAVESNFGTKGAGEWTANIFNWGNVTAGDTKSRKKALEDGDRRVMDSISKGVEVYMRGVKRNYLEPVGGDWESLLKDDNFKNKAGNRYATEPKYESMLSNAAEALPEPEPEPQFGPQRLPPAEEAAAIEAAKSPEQKAFEAELAAGDLPYWNSNTPKGKAIAQYKNMRTAVARGATIATPGLLEYAGEFFSGLNIPERFNNLFNTTDKSKYDPLMIQKDGDLELDEVGFEESKRGKQLNDELDDFLYDTLAFGGDDFFSDAGNFTLSTLEAFNAMKDYVVSGQSVGTATPNAIGNLGSWFSPEELQELIDKQKADGKLSLWGEHIIKDSYNNPENWYTQDMHTGFVFDLATIVANPTGLFNMAKTGVKLVTKGAKGGVSATKALWDTLKKVDPKKLKEVPAITKKAFTKVAKAFENSPRFKEGESLDDLLGLAKKAEDAGVKIADDVQGVVDKAREVKTLKESLPTKVANFFGKKSYKEMVEASDEIKNLTGKTYDELAAMPKADLQKALTSSIEAELKAAKDARTAAQKAQKQYTAHKAAYDDAVANNKFLKDDPVTNNLKAKLERDLTESKAILDNAMEVEAGLQQKVYKYQQTLGNQIDGLSDAGRAEMKAAKEVMDNSNAAAKSARGQALGAETKANLSKAQLTEKLKEFPKLYNKVQKYDDTFKQYLNGTLTLGQVAATIEHAEREAPDEGFAEEVKQIKDQENVPAQDDAVRDPRDNMHIESDIEAEGIQPVVELSGADGITPVNIPEAKIGGGNNGKGGVLKKIGGGLETLAGYAPAIYNIMRGLEKPEKVRRRFVRPQTLKYENMSQPQLNMIDTAFNASLSNARNNSGGLMANFRSNTEAAWADKIARASQVHQQEVGRSMQIANQNIGIRNQAEQINTQTHQKADIMDLQSEAATNSFMAQGMQDVANITSRNRRDANSRSNQDIMMNAINSGRNFTVGPDGTISFKNED